MEFLFLNTNRETTDPRTNIHIYNSYYYVFIFDEMSFFFTHLSKRVYIINGDWINIVENNGVNKPYFSKYPTFTCIIRSNYLDNNRKSQ